MKQLKFTLISDMHGNHDQLKIMPSDVIVCPGDFNTTLKLEKTREFLEWYSMQPSEIKFLVGGNHNTTTFNFATVQIKLPSRIIIS